MSEMVDTVQGDTRGTMELGHFLRSDLTELILATVVAVVPAVAKFVVVKHSPC